MWVLLLPPAYVVRRKGTVFTGVCLLTFRAGTYLPSWGVPLAKSGWGGGTYLPRQGVPPSQAWMEGYLPWMWGYLPWMGGGVPTLDGGGRGTYLGGDGEGVPTLDGRRGFLPFTGYAAGGMPLAFMQEDFLVSLSLKKISNSEPYSWARLV